MSDYTPRHRVVFDVTPEVRKELDEKLAWGDVKAIYTTLTEQLIEMLNNFDPKRVKAGIISKEVTLTNLAAFNNPTNKKA